MLFSIYFLFGKNALAASKTNVDITLTSTSNHSFVVDVITADYLYGASVEHLDRVHSIFYIFLICALHWEGLFVQEQLTCLGSFMHRFVDKKPQAQCKY